MMHLLIGAGTPKEAAARSQSVLFVLRTPCAVTLVVIASEADVLVLSAIHTAWMHRSARRVRQRAGKLGFDPG